MAEDRSIPYALLDNIIGFDDDYESLGERAGAALRDDPMGVARTVGGALYDSARDFGGRFVRDPAGTVVDTANELGLGYVEAGQRLAGGISAYTDQGMSVEEARDAQLMDALTVSELLGGGVFANQLRKGVMPSADVGDSGPADPSRREFLKKSAATAGVAAVAPDAVREVMDVLPTAARRAVGANPLGAAVGQIAKLRKQADEMSEVAAGRGELPFGNRNEYRIAAFKKYDEMADARSAALDALDADTLANASDSDLDMFVREFYDYNLSGYDYLNAGDVEHPAYDALVMEMQKRGLHKQTDRKGLDKYPYARAMVEDYGITTGKDGEFPRPADIDEETANKRIAEAFDWAAELRDAKLNMVRETPDFASEYLNRRKTEMLPAEKIDNIIVSGKADNKSAAEINKKVLETAVREKIPHPKRAFDNPKVEYVDTQYIADNVAQFNYPRYDVGRFGGELPSGNLIENPVLQEQFDASGKETLKENIFNEGIKEPIEVEVVLSDGGISISEGHHRLQAAIELGISEVPIVVTTKAKPRASGIEVMRPAILDTEGLESGQTYSFSELGLDKRLRAPKETPEEIRARGGTYFSDYATGEVSDRKFPQYVTPMREGFYRKTNGFADGGEIASGVGSLSREARDMFRGPRGLESLSRFAKGGEAIASKQASADDLAGLATKIREDYGFDPVSLALEIGVDPELALRLVFQESKGKQSAGSEKGAKGLTQLMPGTAEEMGVDINDARDNFIGGMKYLKKMTDQFGLELGLAAYNAGPGNVAKYEGVPPFKETQDYLRIILEPFQGASVQPLLDTGSENYLMSQPVAAVGEYSPRPQLRPVDLDYYPQPAEPMPRPQLRPDDFTSQEALLRPQRTNIVEKYGLPMESMQGIGSLNGIARNMYS
jgi:hypothetical protein